MPRDEAAPAASLALCYMPAVPEFHRQKRLPSGIVGSLHRSISRDSTSRIPRTSLTYLPSWSGSGRRLSTLGLSASGRRTHLAKHAHATLASLPHCSAFRRDCRRSLACLRGPTRGCRSRSECGVRASFPGRRAGAKRMPSWLRQRPQTRGDVRCALCGDHPATSENVQDVTPAALPRQIVPLCSDSCAPLRPAPGPARTWGARRAPGAPGAHLGRPAALARQLACKALPAQRIMAAPPGWPGAALSLHSSPPCSVYGRGAALSVLASPSFVAYEAVDNYPLAQDPYGRRVHEHKKHLNGKGDMSACVVF